MSFKRADRVADLLKAELADILLREVRDERVSKVTISAVTVTDDLRLARVFFVPLGEEASSEETKERLEGASGFLRRSLGKRLRLKYVPALSFIFDDSFEYGDRIDKLLSEIDY